MTDLRTTVFANLDSAMENGHFEPGEMLHGLTALDIWVDLQAYSPDFEGTDVAGDEVVPLISEWLAKNARTFAQEDILRADYEAIRTEYPMASLPAWADMTPEQRAHHKRSYDEMHAGFTDLGRKIHEQRIDRHLSGFDQI